MTDREVPTIPALESERSGTIGRREFLHITAPAIAAAAAPATVLAGIARAGQGGAAPLTLYLFSKVLQFLDYREMAAAAGRLGLDGIDLTVRPGGHVEPDNFERDLPKAIKAISDAGLRCDMMVTDIVDTGDRRDFELLALARSLGVRRYRTGPLRYPENGNPGDSVGRFGRQLAKLAEWNREIGITGMYQNHSGERRFGAPLWDLHFALRDLDPDALGVQFDVRHAVTDGGLMWGDSFRLIQPHIRSLVVKDFKWAEIDGRWRVHSTPIGEGMVDLQHFFELVKAAGVDCPVSLHCEYDLGGANKGRRELTVPESDVLEAIGRDVDRVRALWAGA